MRWFGFALGAALVWSAAQLLTKRGLAHTSPLFNNLLGGLLSIAINLPLALVGGVEWQHFGAALVFAIATDVGYILYPYALNRGPVTITGTLIGCYPLSTALLSVAILHEHLGPAQVAGIAAIVLGAVGLSLPARVRTSAWQLPWVVTGALAAVLLGAADFTAKVGVGQGGPYTFLMATVIGQIPVAAGLLVVDRAGRRWPDVRKAPFLYTLLGMFGLVAGGTMLMLGFAAGPASLVSPVSSSYVGLSAILAVLFLGERLSWRQSGAVAIAAAGVVLLGAG
jgi:drug/metabolite transporter (DMT)-like permease